MYDTIIIGMGCAGMSAGVYAKSPRRGSNAPTECSGQSPRA